jgi:hypothetical protein
MPLRRIMPFRKMPFQKNAFPDKRNMPLRIMAFRKMPFQNNAFPDFCVPEAINLKIITHVGSVKPEQCAKCYLFTSSGCRFSETPSETHVPGPQGFETGACEIGVSRGVTRPHGMADISRGFL